MSEVSGARIRIRARDEAYLEDFARLGESHRVLLLKLLSLAGALGSSFCAGEGDFVERGEF